MDKLCCRLRRASPNATFLMTYSDGLDRGNIGEASSIAAAMAIAAN
jgi:hypothetical protein